MAIWDSAEFDHHEQVCFFSDEATGLRAIVAIHSTALGPAAGGTRFKPYATEQLAIDDALRLSRAMSYKAALAGLPIGGGKSVIIGDPSLIKSKALLHAFGRFIDRIGNVYATGEDVGMTVSDMETISEVTPYVGGTSSGSGDPSIPTACGVVHGLRAVAAHRFGKVGLEGLTIAVQGLGAVGMGVVERLHAAGAKLIVADVRQDRVARAVEQFGAQPCSAENIHAAEADIFAPCALGGIITEESAARIKAGAVAGSANNQLASPAAGECLAARSVLFAPDYLINAGGIISALEATSSMPGREPHTATPLEFRLVGIYDRLIEIFERADRDGERPELAAERLGRMLIGRIKNDSDTAQPIAALS